MTEESAPNCESCQLPRSYQWNVSLENIDGWVDWCAECIIDFPETIQGVFVSAQDFENAYGPKGDNA